MAEFVVTTSDLTKQYGETMALAGVSLQVRRGSVYGLVGPNGAGKTTLLGVLAGLRPLTAGSYSIDARRIGVLPDTPTFDPWLTAFEVVDLARALDESGVAEPAVMEALARVGLADVAQRRVGGFSRGMLQRLGLAATVIGEPELLLLDEPAAALDPAGRREVLDIVKALQGRATVIFSSHILDDVQQVCDAIGILNHGALAYEGTLDDLVADRGRAIEYRVTTRSEAGAVAERLREAAWIQDVRVDGEAVIVAAPDARILEEKLIPTLASLDVPIVAVAPARRNLEAIFLEVTK